MYVSVLCVHLYVRQDESLAVPCVRWISGRFGVDPVELSPYEEGESHFDDFVGFVAN